MTNDERIAALAALFGCAQTEAIVIDGFMTQASYGHNDILTRQGDHCDKMWLVIDGQAHLQIVDVEGHLKLLSVHGPGEIFGAFPDEKTNLADVIVHDKLSVLQISTSTMMDLLKEYAAIGAGLSRILGRQFNAVLDRMAAQITLTAVGRVYAELLRHADDKDEISPPPVIAALALTAQTTRETGSRAINALERRGVIDRDNNRLKIVSRRMLEEMIV